MQLFARACALLLLLGLGLLPFAGAPPKVTVAAAPSELRSAPKTETPSDARPATGPGFTEAPPAESVAENGGASGASTEDKPASAPRRRVFGADRPSEWRVDPAVSAQGFRAWFGGSGKEPGRFAYPRAMATAADGSLYIVDKSGRIQLFDKEGRLRVVVRTPEIDRGKPTGLAIDSEGRLLVADTHYARVLTYSPSLQLLGHYGEAGSEPGRFLFVTDVVEGPSRRHFVTDYGDVVARVQMFEPDGRLVRAFGNWGAEPGDFQRPMALAYDREREQLIVADAVNHRLQVFDIEGELIKVIGGFGREPGRFKFPYDVLLDEQDRLWVLEFGNHRLQVLDREGRSLATIGEPGRRLGQVAHPWAVALAGDDTYFLLDSGNDRVYVGSRRALLQAEKTAKDE